MSKYTIHRYLSLSTKVCLRLSDLEHRFQDMDYYTVPLYLYSKKDSSYSESDFLKRVDDDFNEGWAPEGFDVFIVNFPLHGKLAMQSIKRSIKAKLVNGIAQEDPYKLNMKKCSAMYEFHWYNEELEKEK